MYIKFIYSILLIPQLILALENKKLVLIGDSLTEGYGVAKESTYGTLLEEKIKQSGKKWLVITSGISGSTSASAPPRMRWVLKSKPDVVLIALGANDALRGLKITETKKNIAEAIDIASSEKIKVILAGVLAPPNYGKDYTKNFAQIYKDLAKEKNVKLIPFLLEGVAGVKELNLADGIHPNEAGHKIIAETVFQAIKGDL